jgi:hypothetical protein
MNRPRQPYSIKFFTIAILALATYMHPLASMHYAKKALANLLPMALTSLHPVRLMQNQWTYGSYNKAYEIALSLVNHQVKSLEARPLSQCIANLGADQAELQQLAEHLNLDTSTIDIAFSDDEYIEQTQCYGHTLKQDQLVIPKTPFSEKLTRQARTVLLGQNMVSIKDKALLKTACLSCIIPYILNNITPYITGQCIPQDPTTPLVPNTSLTDQDLALTFLAIPVAVWIIRYIEYYFQKRADTITARTLHMAEESIDALEQIQEMADQHYAQSNIFKKLYTALSSVLRTAPTIAERIAYLQPIAQQQALEQAAENTQRTR